MKSDFYQSNLNILAQRLPHVAKAIDSADTNGLVLESTKTNDWTIKAGERYLVSRYDPVREIEKRATEFWAEAPDMAAFFGFGLGYQFDFVPRQFSGWIVLYEPLPAVLKLAFSVRDFSKLLANPKFLIVLDIGDLNFDVMRMFSLKVNTKIKTFELFSYRSMFSEKWNEFLDRLEKIEVDKDVHQQTLVAKTKVGFEYLFINLPHVLLWPGVEVLKGLFANQPCVIVASGPSLDKNIHHLKSLKNRALIVACSSAAKRLMDSGITPELCIAIESNDIMYQFDGLKLDETYLALKIRAYPELWRLSPRGFFGYSSAEKSDFAILQKFDRNSVLDVGGSVSTAAFELATLVGANPIILVGLDLAYDLSGRSHAKGTDLGVEDYSESLRLEDADKLKRQGIFFVDGYFGGKVPTRIAWMDYLLWFERKIKAISANGTMVINATEGGARIAGTEQARLADVASSIDTRFDFLKTLDDLAGKWAFNTSDDNWEQLLMQLDELKQLDKLSEKLHQLYKDTFERVSRFNDPYFYYAEQKETKLLEKKAKKLLNKVGYLISPLVQNELVIFYNCFDEQPSEEKRAILNLLNRGQLIYRGISKAAKKLVELIEDSFAHWQKLRRKIDNKQTAPVDEKTNDLQNFTEYL